MAPSHQAGKLQYVEVSLIRPNPDNPRLVFRQGELETLQESIRQYGIQVPVAVFRRRGEFVLIDGERRWRCASKLNMDTIPALVQDEPEPLQNLLLMFNIHALREQWDLLTIAKMLPKVKSLLREELAREPTEVDVSSKTGLSRGMIRRCTLLVDVPEKYKVLLEAEIGKPKNKQTLSEDFFIEMEKALKTVARAMPEVVRNKDAVRDVLLKKYQNKVIDNIVDFRKVGKIARAASVGADPVVAKKSIERLFSDPKYSITQAWNEAVSEAYAERDMVSTIDHLLTRLGEIKPGNVDEDVRDKLEELVDRVKIILGDAT